ncbi:MAG: glycosyltransferase family 9 protein [Bacteroidota bacterium]
MKQREAERQSFSPWEQNTDPRRILIIRFHALGDVAVTLPASRGLRRCFPESEIDFLTLEPHAPFLRSLDLFDRVLTMPAGMDRVERLSHAVRTGAAARMRRYDAIIDLQRNWVSRTIRLMAHPTAWGEFNRFAPRTASDRVLETIHRTGFDRVAPSFSFILPLSLRENARDLLHSGGCNPEEQFIVLNPAGLWKTRHWPIQSYASLARIWLEREPIRFVILGTDRIRESAVSLESEIGPSVINLVGKTNVETAIAILQQSACVISEDSGLMHLAWAAGAPVVALFGSSKHVWSSPTGPLVRVLHSGDLSCGQCMQPECRFGDVHCLTRYTPESVLHAAKLLMPTPAFGNGKPWNA